MRFLIAAAVVFIGPFGAFSAVDTDLPSPAPKVNGVFPHGVQRGTTTEVDLTGQNLHDTTSVQFAGRSVQAEVLSASGSKLKLRVTAAATAEVGRRDYRLTTRRGVYVGVFDIGALPEIRETEKNDDWRKPQPITFPMLVNGIIDSEDWDHFSFEAKAGETLVFDVSATRHGARFDADLAILDPNGEELAWIDDTTIFGDPHLTHKFVKAGTYVIRVGSLGGGPTADYRLSVGRLPYVDRTLPAGLGAGQTTTMTLSGAHMDLIDEVTIGDNAIRGEILTKNDTQASVRFHVPANLAPGSYKLHASHKGQEIALPTVVKVSALPEIAAAPAPVDLSKPLNIRASTVLNGFIEKPRQSHYFRFHARAGETFVFRAESMKLGYHLDPAVTLLDTSGRKLGYCDDPGVDDRADEYQLDCDLSHRFDKEGDYIVAIRDGMYRGGEQLVYRLTVERHDPDFIVELREPLKSMYQGQDSTIQVRVRRRAGWTAPVEVWAEGLPAGVSIDKRTAEPKNSIVKDTCGVDREIDGTIVLLPLHAANAPVARSEFRIKGHGVMNGRTVEHTAIVRYENAAAGYTYGPMEVQTAEMTVVPQPKVLISAPESITINSGQETLVNVSVRRFGEAKAGALTLRTRGNGIKNRELNLPEASRTAKVPVVLLGSTEPASVVFEAVTAEGELLGESVPVTVRIKQNRDTDKPQ